MFFKRERTPMEIVLYGIYTYSRSNSFRLSSEILKPLMRIEVMNLLEVGIIDLINIYKIINPSIKSRIALIDEIFSNRRDKIFFNC